MTNTQCGSTILPVCTATRLHDASNEAGTRLLRGLCYAADNSNSEGGVAKSLD